MVDVHSTLELFIARVSEGTARVAAFAQYAGQGSRVDLGIGFSAGVLKLHVAVDGLDLHAAGAGGAAYRRRVSRESHTCVVGRAAEVGR